MRSRASIWRLCLCFALCPLPAARAADHPFAPLSAAEMKIGFDSVRARFDRDPALPHERLLFPLLVLHEPPKRLVRTWRAGQPFPRQAELQVMHYPSNRSWRALVDLPSRRVVSLQELPAGTEPAISGDEYAAAEALVRAYEPWQRAVRARGLDPKLVYLDSWAAGDAGLPADVAARGAFGERTRLLRVLTFARSLQPSAAEPAARPAPSSATAPSSQPSAAEPALSPNPYTRPVEGLLVTLDLNRRQVLALSDSGVRPVSTASGEPRASEPLRPLTVEQPAGSEIALHGGLVHWRHWQFYAVMHPREGLVLYDVRYEDQGRWRSIAYRLSLGEIYVPYGLADPNWAWRRAFDVGEYNAGLGAQQLQRGLDVPANAQLLDATFFSDLGPSVQNPSGSSAAPGVLAVFERDGGVLWTRTDPSTRRTETRRAHELVATWNCWIGNYVYGFEWVFKLDGSIEVRVQLGGTTLDRGTDARPEASAPKIGKDDQGAWIAAPNHQHFVSFRLDLDVDGPQNDVMEMDVAALDDPAYKNAFDARTQYLEREGFRDADPLRSRHWHVENASARNAFGRPTGYALVPESLIVPYSAADFSGLRRAPFAQHALWVTRYRADEQYPGGQFPNQAPGEDGLNRFIEPSEALRGQDVVLWYTVGFTHLARPEDHPVMSTETIGFKLEPRGFFEHNPALEVTQPP
jgi:primary-amine oxidase